VLVVDSSRATVERVVSLFCNFATVCFHSSFATLITKGGLWTSLCSVQKGYMLTLLNRVMQLLQKSNEPENEVFSSAAWPVLVNGLIEKKGDG
jgi:hypothetical protein